MTITGTDTFDNVIIQNGGVLTLNGTLVVNNSMRINSGGTLTHSGRFQNGLNLSTGDTLEANREIVLHFF